MLLHANFLRHFLRFTLNSIMTMNSRRNFLLVIGLRRSYFDLDLQLRRSKFRSFCRRIRQYGIVVGRRRRMAPQLLRPNFLTFAGYYLFLDRVLVVALCGR